MDSVESILSMLTDRMGSGRDTQIFTPPQIVKEMINELPTDVWNKNTTFLDICCKSGIFLYEIYKKLMDSENLIIEFPDKRDRSEHIINNQLFGISPTIECQMISNRIVYGYLSSDSNITTWDDYTTIIQNKDKTFIYERLKKEFSTVNFDVVVGNPPYNNDIYLDFVTIGHKLASKCSCWITPAKWQAKGGGGTSSFAKI